MNWVLITSTSAKKFLKKLSRKENQHFGIVLDGLTSNPYMGDIEKVKGEEDLWRRRVGNYRIIYEVRTNNRIIYVVDIRRRTVSTY